MSTLLRVGILQAVHEWDPQRAHDFTTHLVQAQMYETPYEQIVLDGDPSPRVMASPLERVDGGPRVRLAARVRANLLFSDGSPATAVEVAAALARSGPLQKVARVEAVDDRVVFELRSTVGSLERLLAKRWCAIALPRGDGFVGTGAFMLAPSRDPECIRLVKNPHHRGRTSIDEIEFVIHPDSARLAAAIERGEIDFTMALSRSEAESLPEARKLFHPGNSTGVLYFNTERAWLADASVRRALASAIDRYRLARLCYPKAVGLTARGPFPPRMSRHPDGLRHDRARAQRTFARLRPTIPDQVTMLTVWAPRPYMPAPVVVAQEIREQLGKLGVDVRIEQAQSSREFTERLQNGDYDMVLGGWIADSEDPGDFAAALMSEAGIPAPDGATATAGNFARWHDPAVEQLLQAWSSGDSKDVLGLLVDRVADQVPFLPIVHGPAVIVHTRRVAAFVPTGSYVPGFRDIELAADAGSSAG